MFLEFNKKLEIALDELRNEKQRKFDQSVDLIINLQKFDPKRNQITLFVNVPFKVKEKKICAFFESENKALQKIKIITPDQFKKYSDKKTLKKLVKSFDFFIAEASLMPKIATIFGRVLGPAGKMPSPQLGILNIVNEKEVEDVIKKINNSLKIRLKESSIKLAVGKQSMKNKEIIENILAVYNAVIKSLPRGKDNIKNLELKFTMTKPKKIVIR